jgi:predicted RNA-binding Zn-ribbon protein involved in translation (DUF1610 family)
MPDKIDAAYRAAHQRCPSCGGVNVFRTLLSWDYAPDENRAHCEDCKWAGIVDHLIAKEG